MTTRAEQELDAIVETVTAGTADDGEAMAAFYEAIRPLLKSPIFGNCLARRVQVEEVEFETSRRGIVAIVRVDGRLRKAALLDVLVAGRSKLATSIRAYQRWAGAATSPEQVTPPSPAAAEAIEAVVLKVGANSARLRMRGVGDELTYRGEPSRLVPGHVVTLTPRKRWKHRSFEYVSGSIDGVRVDVPALGLTPLGIEKFGPMDPDDGEPYADELAELWDEVAATPRVAYELEQVLPGVDPEDWESDPITDAVELRQAKRTKDAEKLLMELLLVDLRCVDAHAHLGNWALDSGFTPDVERALAHYEVGIRIVEQSLGNEFEGFLPWGMLDNRPFLRCLHGYGLALWRLGHREEALSTFKRICVLNPMDNTGARFCWYSVKNGESWDESM
ncbi:MAG: hypothetical protein RIF41_31580 [Polyangiaceae bacterium]